MDVPLALLCTITEIKYCHGFSPCEGTGVLNQYDSSQVHLQVVSHEGSKDNKLVKLLGNCLNQVLGMPPSKLPRNLKTDQTIAEALCNMLVGQCALIHYSDGATDTSITANSIQLAGEGCQTILSYPPFSSTKPATFRLDVSSSTVATPVKQSSVLDRFWIQSPSTSEFGSTQALQTSASRTLSFSHPYQVSTPVQLQSANEEARRGTVSEATPLLQSPLLNEEAEDAHKFSLSCSGDMMELFSECDSVCVSPELLPLQRQLSTPPCNLYTSRTQTFTPDIL